MDEFLPASFALPGSAFADSTLFWARVAVFRQVMSGVLGPAFTSCLDKSVTDGEFPKTLGTHHRTARGLPAALNGARLCLSFPPPPSASLVSYLLESEAAPSAPPIVLITSGIMFIRRVIICLCRRGEGVHNADTSRMMTSSAEVSERCYQHADTTP
ncbi:unnamed protein product [Protopolystoma xenopodis]|uniref:Uncharacterized protein n=1 Tax=Protopolystoma xenopodis TaxID=117903 RepID=A0A3S5C9F5_9PLAT|nr:unnamed protein product [Protopolystoma xenopodis]